MPRTSFRSNVVFPYSLIIKSNLSPSPPSPPLAATGHANSLTTVCNLYRMGNRDCQERFSLPMLRHAAIELTQITTGQLPHPMTELYGEQRAWGEKGACANGGCGDDRGGWWFVKLLIL